MEKSLTNYFDLRKRYAESSKKLKIVAIDFGIKKSILNRFVSHGCEILVLPWRSSLKDVLSIKPDGIFFSNGPGDPSSVSEGIDLARSLIEMAKPLCLEFALVIKYLV